MSVGAGKLHDLEPCAAHNSSAAARAPGQVASLLVQVDLKVNDGEVALVQA